MQLFPRRPQMLTAVVLLGTLGGRGALGGRLVTSAGGPLDKVLTLLKDLKADIVKDGRLEQQTYDKYACWCEEATKKKAEAITTAQDQLRELGQSILKAKGEVAVLAAEVAELEHKIKENAAAQDEATALRKKQNSEYLSQTSELKSAMPPLEQAVRLLIKSTAQGEKDAFLQQAAGARAVVSSAIEKLPSFVDIKPAHLSQLSAFVSANSASGSKYVPQSMTVQGILKDMYATFAADVEDATLDEAKQNHDFEALIAEKIEQMNLHKEEIVKKSEEKANLETKLADESELYDNTEAEMKADVEFFDETSANCKAKSDDWNERDRARTEELAGVTKAIEMLSSDDARELFARAIKPGQTGAAAEAPALVQIASDAAGHQQKAFEALKAHASATKSVRLAMIAASVRQAAVGHFDEVIKSIDEMIATLKEEESADVAKRDQCKEELFKTNTTMADLNWKIEVNEAKIENLELSISKLEEAKTKTIEEIGEANATIKEMKEQRKDENDAFLAAKKDDEDAIALLTDTYDVLASYYNNNSVEVGNLQEGVKDAALAQKAAKGRQGPEFAVSEFDAPETEFSGKSARVPQGKAVLSMLSMVIEDLQSEIAHSIKAEREAQLEFEKMLQASREMRDRLMAKKVQLEGMIASEGEALTEEQKDKSDNEALLADEQKYRKSIEPDCEWVFGSFEERAKKRAMEMDGLVTAKDFLAGYKPGKEAMIASKNRILLGAGA